MSICRLGHLGLMFLGALHVQGGGTPVAEVGKRWVLSNLVCAQSVEQWFDSYFSDQRLAKCYIKVHIGSAMGISLV